MTKGETKEIYVILNNGEKMHIGTARLFFDKGEAFYIIEIPTRQTEACYIDELETRIKEMNENYKIA